MEPFQLAVTATCGCLMAVVLGLCFTLILCFLVSTSEVGNFELNISHLLLLRMLYAGLLGSLEIAVNTTNVATHPAWCNAFQIIWFTLQTAEIFHLLFLLIGQVVHLAKQPWHRQRSRSVYYQLLLSVAGSIALGLVPLYFQSEPWKLPGQNNDMCTFIMSSIVRLPLVLLLVIYCVATPLVAIFAIIVWLQTNKLLRHGETGVKRVENGTAGFVSKVVEREETQSKKKEGRVININLDAEKDRRDVTQLVAMVTIICSILPFVFILAVLEYSTWPVMQAHVTLLGCGLLEGVLLPIGLLTMSATYRFRAKTFVCRCCGIKERQITLHEGYHGKGGFQDKTVDGGDFSNANLQIFLSSTTLEDEGVDLRETTPNDRDTSGEPGGNSRGSHDRDAPKISNSKETSIVTGSDTGSLEKSSRVKRYASSVRSVSEKTTAEGKVARSTSTVTRREWKRQMMEKHLQGGVTGLKTSPKHRRCRLTSVQSSSFESEDTEHQVKFESENHLESERTSMESGSAQGNYNEEDILNVLNDDQTTTESAESTEDSDSVKLHKGEAIIALKAVNPVTTAKARDVSRHQSFAQAQSRVVQVNMVKRHQSLLAKQDMEKVKRNTSFSKLYSKLKRNISKVSILRRKSCTDQIGPTDGAASTNPFLTHSLSMPCGDVSTSTTNPFYTSTSLDTGLVNPFTNPFFSMSQEDEYISNEYKPSLFSDRVVSYEPNPYFTDAGGMMSGPGAFQTNPFLYDDTVDNVSMVSDRSYMMGQLGMISGGSSAWDYDVVEEKKETIKPDGEVTVVTTIRRTAKNPFMFDMPSNSAFSANLAETTNISTQGQRNSGPSPMSGRTRQRWQRAAKALHLAQLSRTKYGNPSLQPGGVFTNSTDRGQPISDAPK